jgi:hypothetical protein
MGKSILRIKFVPLRAILLAQLLLGVGAAAHGNDVGLPRQQAVPQQDSKPKQQAPAPPKAPAKATPDSGQNATQPPSFIQDVVDLGVTDSSSYLAPDPAQIIELLGNPAPFSMKPGLGDTIIIYSSRQRSTKADDDLMVEIENNIRRLAKIHTQAIEIPVANASALGDLLAAIKSLNYDDIKVEAVGNDKIRAICDARISPARFQAFVRDIQHLSAQPKPESPVARVFFVNAPDAVTAVGGAPTPSTKKSSDGSPKSSTNNPNGDTTKPSPKSSNVDPSGSDPKPKMNSCKAAQSTATKDSVTPNVQSPPCPPSTKKQPDAAEPEKNSDTNSSIDNIKPSISVTSLQDLLVFSDEHVGDDAAITERKRILAAIDFPRPEVIINTFSFQTSSTNPDTVYQTASRVRHEIGNYNDGLQAGIGRAWTYLEKRIDSGDFFDEGFRGYLTKQYIADSSAEAPVGLLPGQAPAGVSGASNKTTETVDLSKFSGPEHLATLSGDRNVLGICDRGKYCLGYTSLFHPLRPSLTDMLLAVIASKKPGAEIVNAIDQMEGKVDGGWYASPFFKCSNQRCKEESSQSCEEKYCGKPPFQTCEELDEDQLRTWDFNSKKPTFIFPMNCFRATARLVFGSDSDPTQPSLVRPLRAAVADFLFHYKMSQQYPHEFSAYDLSRSAQELNSELNPLVLAFNRDLAAALRPLKNAADPRFTKGNGWFGLSGHGANFVDNGIITVRTISGKETTVDTVTQNFFDATNPPSITDVITSIGQAQSNVPTVLKANLTADEAAVIIGALNSVKPSQSKVGREFKIDITPRSLSGASAAELEVNMTTQETADPSLYTNGKSDSDNLSRIAKHTTETKVRLESAKLFEISTFTALLQRSRRNFPLVPPFVELPYINSIISLPLPGAKEYHVSTAIMSAIVVPTAADLASGLVFTDDRVALRKDDAKDGNCPLNMTAATSCVIRKAVSTAELQSNYIRVYHKAIIRCFGGGDFFPSASHKGLVDCGSLQSDVFPPESQ